MQPVDHLNLQDPATLIETAQRMSRSARRSDTVARVGGDEFAVILPGIDARGEAQTQCERLIEEVQQPYAFEGQSLNLRVSVGAAIMPEDGTEITALLDQANRAMYAAKRLHKQALSTATEHGRPAHRLHHLAINRYTCNVSAPE